MAVIIGDMIYMTSYKRVISLLEVSSLEQPLAKVERAARKREGSQMLVEQIVPS